MAQANDRQDRMFKLFHGPKYRVYRLIWQDAQISDCMHFLGQSPQGLVYLEIDRHKGITAAALCTSSGYKRIPVSRVACTPDVMYWPWETQDGPSLIIGPVAS